MKTLTHFAQYIPYTGWYALCRVDHPEMDSHPAVLTKKESKVTCPICSEKLEELG